MNNEENNLENNVEKNAEENSLESNANEIIAATEAKTTIGELIRVKREERNLTLKVISQQTKIHIGLLEHLEKNELDKLPSKTYVRGFVKSTAKVLGINQDYALDILDQTYNLKKPVKEQRIYHAPPVENKIHSNLNNGAFNPENLKSIVASYSLTVLKFAIFGAVVIVLGINLKNYFLNSSEDSKVKLPVVLTTMHQRSKPVAKVATPNKTTEEEAKEEKPMTINLIQDKKNEIVTTTAAIPSSTPSATPTNVAVANTVKKLEVVATDVKTKAPTGDIQFAYDNSLSKDEYDVYLPARFRVSPTKGQEQIFVNATEGDSWITYKVDDKEIKKYVLRQGRTVFMRGANIRLFVGNTKNVKVFHNNKFINLNAKSGMKNLVFPDELRNKFSTPLFVFQKDGTVVTSDQYMKENHTTTVPEPNKTLSR